MPGMMIVLPSSLRDAQILIGMVNGEVNCMNKCDRMLITRVYQYHFFFYLNGVFKVSQL